MELRIRPRVRVATVALAGLGLLAACGPQGPIAGEIRDDAITLAVDHAGQSVILELRNTGSRPCDLIVSLTSLPMDALPVEAGQVVITRDGSPNKVRPMDGGEFQVPLEAGGVRRFELALEGTPATDNRVVLCNAAGDYESGRYAVLTFDR
jgi:hypothetical protein